MAKVILAELTYIKVKNEEHATKKETIKNDEKNNRNTK